MAKGGVGNPVNCCTMARKLEVSVARTVVGARLEALDRFLDPLGTSGAADEGGGGGAEAAGPEADGGGRAAVEAELVENVAYEWWVGLDHRESRGRELCSGGGGKGKEKGKEAR